MRDFFLQGECARKTCYMSNEPTRTQSAVRGISFLEQSCITSNNSAENPKCKKYGLKISHNAKSKKCQSKARKLPNRSQRKSKCKKISKQQS